MKQLYLSQFQTNTPYIHLKLNTLTVASRTQIFAKVDLLRTALLSFHDFQRVKR